MSSIKFKRENLFLAEVKYFDKEKKGIEVSDNLSYVVVARCGNEKDGYTYFNALDMNDIHPVFERSSCYTNYYNGMDYGNKMIFVGGWLENGPCWVIKSELSRRCFDEDVSLEEIEEAVLNSSNYFKDRKNIALKRFKKMKEPFKMIKIILDDSVKEDYYNYFFMERIFQKQKIK